MDYLQQAYGSLHDWWRYLVGGVIIFIAWQVIGMIPLMIFLGIEIMNGASLSAISDISQMASLLGKNLFLFLMLLSFAIGLVGVVFSAKVLHKQSFLRLTTARSKIDWSRTLFAFLLWGIVSAALIVLEFYLTPDDYVINFNLQAFAILAGIAILLLPLQTSFEEYLFRGYLMQGFAVLFKNRWLPLLITSLGFGLLHIFNPEVEKLGYNIMIFYVGTGLLLGIMTLMDDGLELALGFHAANNLVAALLVTADWTALQTDSVLKDISDPSAISILEISGPVFVIYPILLFILAKKYKWTNWKDKLFGVVPAPHKDDYKILEDYDTTI